MTRQRLPNRRRSERLDFQHDGIAVRGSASRYADGTLGEIFLSLAKPDGRLADLLHDLAVCASLALQFGCPADVLQHALVRAADGSAGGPLGHLLDLLGEAR